jgi:hypothetical protein
VSTTAQHMAALHRASEVRLARCEVKRALCEGRMTVAEALGEECVASMNVEELLRAQRRWGPLRACGLLRHLEIGFTRRVDELTDRQRELVGQACGLHARRRAT